MNLAGFEFAGFKFCWIQDLLDSSFAGFEICWTQFLLESRFAGFDHVIEMQARGLSWSRMSS